MSLEDLVDLFLHHNLDFRDSRGHPLRCLHWLRRQAEAAATGMSGKMPDPLERAEATLQADATAFMNKKKAGRG